MGIDSQDFGKPLVCPHSSHTDERIKRFGKISQLSAEELKIRLGDIRQSDGNAAMIAASKKMIDAQFGWLYIHGGPGNAKTVALMAMVNEINLSGHGPAMYIKMTKLVNWMRQSFQERKAKDIDPYANLGYIQRFERLQHVKFLAIDEVDKLRETEFADEFRFDFFDERYRDGVTGKTATVFASNDPADTLPPAIYDRIRDGRFMMVENKTESAREFMGRV